MRMLSKPPKGHVWQQDRHDPHFGRPTGTVGDPERWYSMFASESVAPSGMQSRIGVVQVNRGPVCPRRAPCGVRERVVAPEPIDFERRERVRAEARPPVHAVRAARDCAICGLSRRLSMSLGNAALYFLLLTVMFLMTMRSMPAPQTPMQSSPLFSICPFSRVRPSTAECTFSPSAREFMETRLSMRTLRNSVKCRSRSS